MTTTCDECNAPDGTHYGHCSHVPPEMKAAFAAVEAEATERGAAEAKRRADMQDRIAGSAVAFAKVLGAIHWPQGTRFRGTTVLIPNVPPFKIVVEDQ